MILTMLLLLLLLSTFPLSYSLFDFAKFKQTFGLDVDVVFVMRLMLIRLRGAKLEDEKMFWSCKKVRAAGKAVENQLS